MRRIEFSPDVLSEIERDRFKHLEPAVQRRMEALWLKAHGETHQRIAELAGLSRPTVQRLLDTYLSGGLAAVRTFHWKVPVSALDPHRPLLEEEFRQRPPHTTAEACERIKQLTGVERSETRVREFLRDTLNLRWRKVGAVPLPPKLSLGEHAAKQAAFLKDGA
jgi:transposase